jgi:hypothetical protein
MSFFTSRSFAFNAFISGTVITIIIIIFNFILINFTFFLESCMIINNSFNWYFFTK